MHLSDQEVASVAAASPGMAGRDLKDLSEQAERRWASKVGPCIPLCDAVVATALLSPFQLQKLEPLHTLHISVEQLWELGELVHTGKCLSPVTVSPPHLPPQTPFLTSTNDKLKQHPHCMSRKMSHNLIGVQARAYVPYVSDSSSTQGNLFCLHLLVTEGDHCRMLMIGELHCGKR